MQDYRTLLRMPAFWWYYQRGNDEDVALLAETVPLEEGPDGRLSVTIQLACPFPFAVEIGVDLRYYGMDLSLANNETGKHAQLGWWDDARWHPYALRWAEVERLAGYWQRYPPSADVTSTEAFLLLARFVGHGVDELSSLVVRRQRIAAAYRELNVFQPAEIEELAAITVALPTEKDYRWTQHEKLGWVFGGEYPCYTIRNAEHTGGEEGRFPFSDFRRLMDAVERPNT